MHQQCIARAQNKTHKTLDIIYHDGYFSTTATLYTAGWRKFMTGNHFSRIISILAVCTLTACAEGKSDSNGGNSNPPIYQECQLLNCEFGCCNGQCVDLRNDPNHCGTCTNQCLTGFCENSTCTTSCTGESLRMCQGSCTNISNDSNNCGGCQISCGRNMGCFNSQCK